MLKVSGTYSPQQLQEISNQVKFNHEEEGWSPYLRIIEDRFGSDFYEVGGSIRNAAITIFHGSRPLPSDVDIIVPGDPKWVRATADELPGIVKNNSFDNRKWLVDNKEIDIVAMQDRAESIQEWIEYSDLFIGAIAYGGEVIYDNGALNCITQRTIERNPDVTPTFPHSSRCSILNVDWNFLLDLLLSNT